MVLIPQVTDLLGHSRDQVLFHLRHINQATDWDKSSIELGVTTLNNEAAKQEECNNRLLPEPNPGA